MFGMATTPAGSGAMGVLVRVGAVVRVGATVRACVATGLGLVAVGEDEGREVAAAAGGRVVVGIEGIEVAVAGCGVLAGVGNAAMTRVATASPHAARARQSRSAGAAVDARRIMAGTSGDG
jgi:hypothetical protein